ncbi:MAG TPA: TolC family protein [Polyangiaceae bacterium]|nr:TolC family protein [Polyangiaceae bacterium]
MRRAEILTAATLLWLVPQSTWAASPAAGAPAAPASPATTGAPAAPATAGTAAPTTAATAAAPHDSSAPPRLSSDAPVPTIGYADAIDRATADTPRMAQARANVLRAEARVTQSRATWLPTLNGVANYTRLDADRQINGNITTAANSLNLSMQLMVPIFVPVRWTDTARQSDSRDVAKGNLENERRLAVVDVTRAYLAVILEKRGVEIGERALETARRELDFAHTRQREGIGSRLEVARSEREVHDNEANLTARRSALRTAQEVLGVATFSDGPRDASGEVDVGRLPALAEALREVKSRPDLVALRRQAESDGQRVDDAWLDYVPTLTGSAQAWHQDPPTVNYPDWGWQAQLLLVLPLYDGGKRYGDQDERRAAQMQSRSALRQAELQADSDLRTTAAQADERFQAWREAERSAELAREALELSRLAYREGTGTQLDLIEAERSVRDAETNSAIAQTAWLQAQVLYRLAAGKL